MMEPTRGRLGKANFLCAGAVTLLAALPRLALLNLAEFKADEANHYLMAYNLTRGGWSWVGSRASVGIPKPPLFVYTLAVPMQFSLDPRVVTGFLGVLAALAVGGFYLILRRYLRREAAFGGALLFALNPQAILYSRKLFTADLLPPLCTLFLAAAVVFLHSPARRLRLWAPLVGFAFALLLLNTFSPLLLMPAVILLFWLRRRDLTVLDGFAAAAAFGVPFIPYLLEVAPRIGGAFSDTASSLTPQPPVVRWIWTLLFGAPWPANTLHIAGIAATGMLLLSVAGMVWLVSGTRKRETRSWALFCAAWLCAAPLLALIAPIEVHAHYLVVLYPILFVLPAAGVQLAFDRTRAMGWVTLAVVLMAAGWQAQIWLSNMKAVAVGVEGYGTPLGYWWSATEQARVLAAEHEADEVLLLLPGDKPHDEKAAVLDALLLDTPHRVVDGRITVVYPPHKAMLLIASEVPQAMALCELCTEDIGESLPASPFGGTYHFRLWLPDTSISASCTPVLEPASVQWASGASLLGYNVESLPQTEEGLQVMLHWETSRGPLSEDIHWFNHLLDAEGRKWGQLDHAGWPSSRWQPGDQVIHFFSIQVEPLAPPGPYLLRLGQYTYPAIENIPVLDAAGNPASDAVELPIAP